MFDLDFFYKESKLVMMVMLTSEPLLYNKKIQQQNVTPARIEPGTSAIQVWCSTLWAKLSWLSACDLKIFTWACSIDSNKIIQVQDSSGKKRQ